MWERAVQRSCEISFPGDIQNRAGLYPRPPAWDLLCVGGGTPQSPGVLPRLNQVPDLFQGAVVDAHHKSRVPEVMLAKCSVCAAFKLQNNKSKNKCTRTYFTFPDCL